MLPPDNANVRRDDGTNDLTVAIAKIMVRRKKKQRMSSRSTGSKNSGSVVSGDKPHKSVYPTRCLLRIANLTKRKPSTAWIRCSRCWWECVTHHILVSIDLRTSVRLTYLDNVQLLVRGNPEYSEYYVVVRNSPHPEEHTTISRISSYW